MPPVPPGSYVYGTNIIVRNLVTFYYISLQKLLFGKGKYEERRKKADQNIVKQCK